MKTVYIAGLGAIGGAYGSIMLDHGLNTLGVLVNQARFERYSKRPIRVNGVEKHFNFIVPTNQSEPADLILVACKYNQLHEVLDLIQPVVTSDTLILPLLNGIDSEELVAQYFSKDNVLNALCFGIDSLRENGDIVYGNPGRIVFGELQNVIRSERVKKVAEFFDQYGVPYEIPEDFQRVQWRKFMINVGSNLTSAVMLANYGVFKEVDEAKELMVMVMKEVIQLANVMGISISQEDIDVYLKLLPSFDGNGKSSTQQDMEANRLTEVDMFAGVVRRLGREYGVPTPCNDMLYYMIKTMEKMRGAHIE